MFKKLNNKGNTLAIVIIGIFILAILGTLILGTTSTNYMMKVNDKRVEMTFYYAERAMDEVYAGIGQEVMEKVTMSYTEAVDSYVSKGGMGVIPAGEDPASYTFRTMVRSELTDMFIKGNYGVSASGSPLSTNPDSALTASKQLLNRMFASITPASGYTFKVYPADGTMKVTYYKTVAGALQPATTSDTSDKIDLIKIENVGVSCTNKTGFTSSVVTDLEIAIPNVALDFTDSPYAGDITDLSRYALVCEGFQVHPRDISLGARNSSPIVITNRSHVNIKGNIYTDGTVYNITSANRKTLMDAAGSPILDSSGSPIVYYVNSSNVLKRNASISVEKGVKLNINSKIVYCENDFIMDSDSTTETDRTVIVMGNEDGGNTTQALDSLQFYTGNIETKSGSKGANFLFLGGNCIVKDDLELNGDESSIYIGGNYFGYGFRDSNTDGVEDNTNAVNAIDVGGGIDDPNDEHRDSSAIIINGNKATVNMTGSTVSVNGSNYTVPRLQKLVLLGRAYIDLDATGTHHTYMTGESISYKGNQNIYLASTNDVLAGSSITLNPMDQASLMSTYGVTTLSSLSYSMLGLDSNQVVAKRVKTPGGSSTDGKIYFYIKNLAPDTQTSYFRNTINSSYSSKRAELINNLGSTTDGSGLDVQSTQIWDSNLDYYTVGAIMNVSRSGSTATIAMPNNNFDAGKSLRAFDIATNRRSFVDVVNNRADNIRHKLNDLSEDDVLLADPAAISSVTEDTVESAAASKSPYEYFINREKVLAYTGNTSKTILFTNLNVHGANKAIYHCDDDTADGLNQQLKNILTRLGVSTSARIGVFISNANTSGDSEVPLDAGVVIGEQSYALKNSFTGLIINNDSMLIDGNINITADEELTKFMFENVYDLQNLLNDNFRSTSTPAAGEVVGDNDMDYTSVIKKTNWHRDTN